MLTAIFKGLASGLETTSLVISRITGFVVVVLAIVMIVSLLLGVLFRYALHSPLSWSGEIALLAFSWIILLTASMGVRDGFHVRIAIIHKSLPGLLSRFMDWLILIAVIGFGISLLVTGYMYTSLAMGQVSPAIGYPMWVLNLSVPVTGALIAMHGTARLLMHGRIDH